MLLLKVIILAISSRAVLGQGFYDAGGCTITDALDKTVLKANCAGTDAQINLHDCVGNSNGILVGSKK